MFDYGLGGGEFRGVVATHFAQLAQFQVGEEFRENESHFGRFTGLELHRTAKRPDERLGKGRRSLVGRLAPKPTGPLAMATSAGPPINARAIVP